MTHASLFSGIGGPEVAAAMLGWENVFHCEINDFCRKILEYHFPNSISYTDVTKTDFTEWRGRIDVLTGGFPCQPFSYAGERRGAEDDRYLWPEFERVISEIRPTWVVGENVSGITTMVEPGEVTLMGSEASLFCEEDSVHRYKYEQPFTIERVCSDLEQLGYTVQPVLIPACAVGAPHRRDRVFIVARRVAADTICGGSSAPEKQGERERTQVQQQSREQLHYGAGRQGDARSTTAAFSEDAMHLRRSKREDEERINSGEQRNTGTGDTEWHGCEERAITSDTTSLRRRKIHEQMESQLTDGNEPVCNGRKRYPADASRQRLEMQNEPGREESWKRMCIWRNIARCNNETAEDFCGNRWANFPTVSPVHRGNDGIPFPLDCLTISPNKWRTESLKAYGNAIVPQVMYEIFRAIEQVTNQQK